MGPTAQKVCVGTSLVGAAGARRAVILIRPCRFASSAPSRGPNPKDPQPDARNHGELNLEPLASQAKWPARWPRTADDAGLERLAQAKVQFGGQPLLTRQYSLASSGGNGSISASDWPGSIMNISAGVSQAPARQSERYGEAHSSVLAHDCLRPPAKTMRARKTMSERDYSGLVFEQSYGSSSPKRGSPPSSEPIQRVQFDLAIYFCRARTVNLALYKAPSGRPWHAKSDHLALER